MRMTGVQTDVGQIRVSTPFYLLQEAFFAARSAYLTAFSGHGVVAASRLPAPRSVRPRLRPNPPALALAFVPLGAALPVRPAPRPRPRSRRLDFGPDQLRHDRLVTCLIAQARPGYHLAVVLLRGPKLPRCRPGTPPVRLVPPHMGHPGRPVFSPGRNARRRWPDMDETARTPRGAALAGRQRAYIGWSPLAAYTAVLPGRARPFSRVRALGIYGSRIVEQQDHTAV